MISGTTAPTEIHQSVTAKGLEHKLSPTTIKIMSLSPELLLGEPNILEYDPVKQAIVLSSPFRQLLELLVQLGKIEAKSLSVRSIDELNTILQQGLLRKEGTERWHLSDSAKELEVSTQIQRLFKELGFVTPKLLDTPTTVDHCIIFGARVERMGTRIHETVRILQTNLNVRGHIFLLGSNRKLIPAEIDYLKPYMDEKWTELFQDPEQATEANAFVLLWESIVPKQLQDQYKNRLVGIKSTRIGHSYKEKEGHRATTEVTAEDWMAYYSDQKPQSIFAVVEQPYIRLADQLRLTVLSNGKKATLEMLVARIASTTFDFAYAAPDSPPLISVTLDEIARSVYRIRDTLNYLEHVGE